MIGARTRCPALGLAVPWLQGARLPAHSAAHSADRRPRERIPPAALGGHRICACRALGARTTIPASPRARLRRTELGRKLGTLSSESQPRTRPPRPRKPTLSALAQDRTFSVTRPHPLGHDPLLGGPRERTALARALGEALSVASMRAAQQSRILARAKRGRCAVDMRRRGPTLS